METALWPLQKALFGRWSNDTAIKEKGITVYDYVPKEIFDSQGNPIPVPKTYITIGEPIVSPFETKSSYREEIPWTHHVWSDYNGKKECYDIMSLMLNSLSSQPLSLEGGFIMRRFKSEQLQVITDIDNTTYHGIMRIRYYIDK